jgi:dTDP-4-amino-4,6-dideoxygalactose transaminase
VPTMTFAATAEIVRYQGAVPILVDCNPETTNLDLADAARKLDLLKEGKLSAEIPSSLTPVGIIPVHVGGVMLDIGKVSEFAEAHRLWIIEDAAHAFPAAWRPASDRPWQRCGEETAAISCYSFYANKTITTGEGGMAVTNDASLADRMRLMSLHGLSHDAWKRYSGGSSWDYRILAAGYKYNMTDIAAALGVRQLERAEAMRAQRETLAMRYRSELAGVEEIELPAIPADRIHSWHLFPIRLRLERLKIARDQFITNLREHGVGCSVHWRPLHLHPYYAEQFGWRPDQFPLATALWERLITLPLFPSMRDEEHQHVVSVVRGLCRELKR